MAKTTEINLASVNLVAQTTSVKGDISTQSDIRIDGNLTGNLKTSGRLIIGPNGSVNGDVICKTAEIEGDLKGKIDVQELLSLKSTAKYQGEIITSQLLIEPGAVFSGTCSMKQGKDK
ncbi:MAG: polymer-forming cytoskeletal protein [Prolixibacteraceae bacterium]|nr:polymer-forming cytoskeletal protein [Prolixibacteraceae bacterium]